MRSTTIGVARVERDIDLDLLFNEVVEELRQRRMGRR